ncbi:MAG TPA: RDD family protein [Nocardioides sp.]|nr:RDD family protein [Nocardioides sp.]
MTSQPGWHPDPVPSQPGQPPQLRYWDGTRWTAHVAPVQPPAAQYSTPPAYQGTYGATYPQPATPGYGAKPPPTTPDGVRLAGWWHRAGAYLLDALIVGILTAVVAIPWLRDVWHTYRDWIDELIKSTENGGDSTVDTGQLQHDLARPLAIIVAIQLVISFCYHVGFLMWRQATPGKLMTGLRVRLRERPGPMPLGTVVVRWLSQFGVAVLGLVPFIGSLTGVYSLLDDLWPLWDQHNQAIHDKLAKTNVVVVG